MFFPKMPKVGDEVQMYVTGPVSRVIALEPYTGRYPEFFTHNMKYTSHISNKGWMEITIDVGEERIKK